MHLIEYDNDKINGLKTGRQKRRQYIVTIKIRRKKNLTALLLSEVAEKSCFNTETNKKHCKRPMRLIENYFQ